ncbi:hypothetical protein BGZ99_008849 [Dissophora globulifera]|uniref:Uncharacterized protein n=1 Tax=Dissophora globulifera TaxID=979702 RepID=A0A9P6R8N0_9FUNG|nr:hypothetical protein BGZ99_008849 [Dissophora globulifera]
MSVTIDMSSASAAQRVLEEYAFHPPSRQAVVDQCIPGTREHSIYRLRLLLQELQDPAIPITVEKIDEAMSLLPLLAYSVKPELLLKELAFNPNTVTQLNNTAVVPVPASDQDPPQQGVQDLCDSLPTALDETLIQSKVVLDGLMDSLIKAIHPEKVLPAAWPYLLGHPKIDELLRKLKPSELQPLLKSWGFFIPSKSYVFADDNSDNIDDNDYQHVARLGHQSRGWMDDGRLVGFILRLHQIFKLDFSESVFSHQSQYLTSAQLETIKVLLPYVMADEGFVGLLEKRIVPHAYIDIEQSAKGVSAAVNEMQRAHMIHDEWLTRMLAFVDSLSSNFNKHKLAVYLMSLEFDMARGIMDKAKFMRYIGIPRNHDNYNADTLKQAHYDKIHIVTFGADSALTYWSSRVRPATRERDGKIVEEFLTHFLRLEKSTTDYEIYFDLVKFLQPMLARTMLTSGEDVTKWSAMLPSSGDLHRLAVETIIRFAHHNQETFLPSDPVVFKLKVKNVKRVLVRVFEVKTLEYLKHHSGPIGRELNLDGLTPNWEHNLTLDHPPLEIHDLDINLPELAGRRGAFVMDVISNGENSTVYFTKCTKVAHCALLQGYFDYLERQSVAGHVLTIIDENRQKISEDVSVWFSGHYYEPNDDGDINIPYRNPSNTSDNNIFVIHGGFTSKRPFTHHAESYSMDLLHFVDHESLVAGTVAKILLKPVVTIDRIDVTCPVELLEQVSLEVHTYDINGTETTSSTQDFKVYDADWSEYNFPVPENFSRVDIILSAKIKVLTTGNYKQLSAIKKTTVKSNDANLVTTIEVKDRRQAVQIDVEILTVLRKTESGTRGYEILVIGKNENPLSIYLRSNAEGIIRLGDLQDVTGVICYTTKSTWSLLTQDQHKYPDYINGFAGEPIRVPFSRRDSLSLLALSLFRRSPDAGVDRCYIEDMTDNIKLTDGLLTIDNLEPGYYTLRLGEDHTIELNIASSIKFSSTVVKQAPIKGFEEFSIHSNPMLEIPSSSKYPLFLTTSLYESLTEDSRLSIRVHNWTSMTRICVVATKFQPYKTLTLGDEYQYILNRRTQTKHWAGNLLSKPSVLLSPWSIGDTAISSQYMEASSNANAQTTSNTFGSTENYYGGKDLDRGGAKRHSTTLPPGAAPLLTFLAHPSVVLLNLIPDPTTGEIIVPYTEFKEGNFVQILVTDGSQAAQTSFAISSLARNEFSRRDLRFKSALDHEKHYIGERTGVNLDPKLDAGAADSAGAAGEPYSITLPSNGSSPSSVRVIHSVSQVYDLMMTLLESQTHRNTLRNFRFIVDWHRFSTATKNEEFSKWNCHELNLFLYKKDKPYFDAVVAPFLKNKLVKSFMDDFLIEESLEKYTTLREFQLLTCMEKCLLARRVPQLRPSVALWIKSRVRNTRIESDVKLFKTVMKSGAVEKVAVAPLSSSRKEDRTSMFKDFEAKVDDDHGFEMIERQFSASNTIYPPSSLMMRLQQTPQQQQQQPMPQVHKSPALNSMGIKPLSVPPQQLRLQQQQLQDHPRINSIEARQRTQQQLQQLQQFKPVDLTKEMAETYYWGRQDAAVDSGNMDVNAFWLDFVEWNETKGGSFLTQEINEPPVVGSVIVTQKYYEQRSKYEYNTKLMTNVRKYLWPGTELRPLVTYGAHIVLINATPNPMRVHLEIQLPQGTMPLYKPFESVQVVQLHAHCTFQCEYEFYFPEEGDYPHYPAHLLNHEDIIAYAPPSVLKVRAFEPAFKPDRLKNTVDTTTWNYVLSRGSHNDVLKKLAIDSLEGLQVELLIPRLYRDRELFEKVTDILRNRYEYIDRIWSVSLVLSGEAGREQRMRLVGEYVANHDIAQKVGNWFTSPLLTRRPKSRYENKSKAFHYLEYFPLINARVHKANKNATILNDRFKDQYQKFLTLLAQKPRHDVDDLLVLIIYLIAQDRILEAKEQLSHLSTLVAQGHLEDDDRKGTSNNFQQIQYDYLRAYLSLCVEVQANDDSPELDLEGVRAIVNKYQNYPVQRWNKLFKDMKTYVDEIAQVQGRSGLDSSDVIDGDMVVVTGIQSTATGQNEYSTTSNSSNSSNKTKTSLAHTKAVPATVEFKIGSDSQIEIRHRGVQDITVEYYAIDAETMFSASPLTFSDHGESEANVAATPPHQRPQLSFSSASSTSYRLVKPNGVDHHFVSADMTDGLMRVPVLERYLNTNAMVSVTTVPPSAVQMWKAYYSQTVSVQCQELTGTIRVVTKAASSSSPADTDTTAPSTVAVADTMMSQPIRGGYVKVYARMRGGLKDIVFWKDGYTDLVGRFDYAKVSTRNPGRSGGLTDIERFVVFVDSGKEGCVVKTLPVPPV